MASMPEEQKNDFPERREGFLKEYKQLIDKYQVDFLSTPVALPTERGSWSLTEFGMRVDVMDTKNLPTPSPLQFKNITL